MGTDPEANLLDWRRLSFRRATRSNPYASFPVSAPVAELAYPSFGNLASAFHMVGSKSIKVVVHRDFEDGVSQSRQELRVIDPIPETEMFLHDDVSLDDDGSTVLDGKVAHAYRHRITADQSDTGVKTVLAIALNGYRVCGLNGTCGPLVVDALLRLGDRRTALLLADKVRNYFVQHNNAIHAADWHERCGLILASLATDKHTEIARECQDALERDPRFYFRMAKIYYAAAGDTDGRARASLLEIEERCKYERWSKRAIIAVMRSVWLHGESPLAVARAIFVLWLVFALLYLFSGFRISSEHIAYSLSVESAGKLLADFGQALYLSAVTMTTLGYGDATPTSWFAKIAAGAEALLGITLAAMLIAAIQKRYGT